MSKLAKGRAVSGPTSRHTLHAIALAAAALFADACLTTATATEIAAELAPDSSLSRTVEDEDDRGDVEFDRSFLRGMSQSIDLAPFERDETITEGIHPAEVNVNGMLFGTQKLSYSRNPATRRVEPCFDKTFIARIGIDPARQLKVLEGNECVFLDQVVEGGTVEYDRGEQKLTVSIPQAFLLNSARGYVPPDLLDNGVTAAMFRYSLSYSNTRNSIGPSGQYLYGGLESSFNFGPWRFRSFGTLTSNEGTPTRWNHTAAYLQRALPSLQAEATIGDWSTTGALFDTTSIRGFSLATDDRQLPESQRGYAPTVRGVARTNAVVTVRQGSNVVFESNVPPGEFAFSDLYATGYGGDLEVTVTEADGSIQKFVVPYGSLAQLLRPGYTKFSATWGEIRDNALSEAPILMEGTVQHGLTNDITLYGGVQITAPTYYAAGMAGLAVNTPLGALGLDLTQSYAFCVDFAHTCGATGHSVRANLGKLVAGTGTYFSLVGYRYSSPGFYSLSDALHLREYLLGNTEQVPLRLRDRFDVNITQTLGPRWGNLFLTGSYGRRWEDNGRTLSFQAGYTNSLGPARYNISIGRVQNGTGSEENSMFLTVSLPLGKSVENPANLSLSASRIDGADDLRANVTGNIGQDGRLGYDAWAEGATSGHSRAFGGGLSYVSDAVKGNVSYGNSTHTNTIGVNATGGVVVHDAGVKFVSELGDTIAIVQAEGATGAHVMPNKFTTIDEDGIAIVPYVTPFQWNNIDLDLKDTDMGVEVDNSRITTAPTAGAAVKLVFDSRRSTSAVMRARRADGKAVPFGSSINLPDGTTAGTVGGGGNFIVSGLTEATDITVKWGNTAQDQCVVHFVPDADAAKPNRAPVEVREVVCEPKASTSAPAPTVGES
ncbi:fimbria/pilus outer membrane usher protein [Cupriavidus pauculus]|uniref:fimbria/pilus outer membrane usher protein n=1 Tax=Cupriavidus pauculus TaxID=82633 RepID=UPI0030FCFD63